MVEVGDDSPLGVMNRIRKGFRAKSRRLARLIPRQTIEFLAANEESFRELQEDIPSFHSSPKRLESKLEKNLNEVDSASKSDSSSTVVPSVASSNPQNNELKCN